MTPSGTTSVINARIHAFITQADIHLLNRRLLKAGCLPGVVSTDKLLHDDSHVTSA